VLLQKTSNFFIDELFAKVKKPCSRTNRDWDLQPILGIPIEDEKPGSRSIRKRLSQLLYDLCTGGMPHDVEMRHTSAVVANDEETVKNPKCKGWDGEEVSPRSLPDSYVGRRANV
jgi:hypothetical protein